MKDYLYYKQHNKESYDYDITVKGKTPKEAILLNCISCKQTYTNAYHCNESECQFYNYRKNWIKRPHTCSEWFKENRNRIEDRWIS